MELTFTRSKLLNTVVLDESGRPIYRIETPGRALQLAARTSTISKFRHSAGEAGDDAEYVQVAKIEWRYLHPSVYVLGDVRVKVKDYLPSGNLLRSRRTFTASNGQSYQWVLGHTSCPVQLKRTDGSGFVVARFHRKAYGCIGEAHHAYLDLTPEVIPMMDEVLMTFLWTERRRKQVEGQAIGNFIGCCIF
ncbi:hypothetical protein BC834DRAFT_834187 [Gloeopeniophorella convolvens]|nr:hypothetical protein BC834DRAFT_834187 [Gloeopeniophorella convolvens]